MLWSIWLTSLFILITRWIFPLLCFWVDKSFLNVVNLEETLANKQTRDICFATIEKKLPRFSLNWSAHQFPEDLPRTNILTWFDWKTAYTVGEYTWILLEVSSCIHYRCPLHIKNIQNLLLKSVRINYQLLIFDWFSKV